MIKKNIKFSIKVVLLLFYSFFPTKIVAEIQNVNITGKVIDENGNPISDVFMKTWPNVLTTTSDQQGNFEIENMIVDQNTFIYAIKDSYFTGCSMVPDSLNSVQLNLLITTIPNHLNKISPYLFGSSYWKPYHQDLDFFKEEINNAAINMLRLGGIGFDGATREWNETAIDNFIDFCNSIDAEPIIQVQLYGGSPQNAADMVQYANFQKGYDVRYWSIGNEPDIYNDLGHGPYTVNDYIVDFRNFYNSMKSVDSSIIIAGPDLAWNYNIHSPDNWLTPFLEACGDIVNIITIHRYPFDGSQSIDQTLQDPQFVEVLIDETREEIIRITDRRIPIGITETNLSWQWTGTGDGFGDSFYAGLWWAETLGRLIKKGVFIANIWSLVGDGPISIFSTDDSTYGPRRPRPTYFVLNLFKDFHNNYLSSDVSTEKLATFASQDDHGNLVMITVNKSQTTDYRSKLNFNLINPLSDIFIQFPKLSIVRTTIEASGNISEILLYTSTEFDSQIPPIVADSLNLGTINDFNSTITIDDGYLTSIKEKIVQLPFAISDAFPNPFNSSTTISYSLHFENNIRIIIYNIIGKVITQLASSNKTPGNHSVQWDGKDYQGNPVGTGIYLYQIQAGDFIQTKKVVLLK